MLNTLKDILNQYPILAPAIFIVIRASAIILPPIPGIIIDLIGIVVFPWFLGFMYGEIGVVLGAMRFVFTFIIPSLVVGALPIEIIRDISIDKLILCAFLALIWLIVSFKIFKWGVKKYESSNFMTFGG